MGSDESEPETLQRAKTFFEERLLPAFRPNRESLPMLSAENEDARDIIDVLVGSGLIRRAGGTAYGIGDQGRRVLMGIVPTERVLQQWAGLDEKPSIVIPPIVEETAA